MGRPLVVAVLDVTAASRFNGQPWPSAERRALNAARDGLCRVLHRHGIAVHGSVSAAVAAVTAWFAPLVRRLSPLSLSFSFAVCGGGLNRAPPVAGPTRTTAAAAAAAVAGRRAARRYRARDPGAAGLCCARPRRCGRAGPGDGAARG